MAKLIYSAITSLDGYIADEDGNFGWAAPDEEAHSFVNDLERPVGTYLYGRRMYEVMAPWETDPTLADQSRVMRDFAELWQAADKIVYSTSLETPSTASTRIERDFDPEAVRQLKTQAERDITVGGPDHVRPNCWTNAVSATAWFTSATPPGPEETATLLGPSSRPDTGPSWMPQQQDHLL
jgi:dihydrofolate reductase